MTAGNKQIVTAYEDLGMSIDEIAHTQELEPLSVKAVLMQFSSLFRQDLKKDEVEFTDEEHQTAKDVIVNTARYSEDERVRLKAAMYIRDDKKGRLDVLKQFSGLNINVFEFNETMRKAIAAKNRAKGIVDVECINK